MTLSDKIDEIGRRLDRAKQFRSVSTKMKSFRVRVDARDHEVYLVVDTVSLIKIGNLEKDMKSMVEEIQEVVAPIVAKYAAIYEQKALEEIDGEGPLMLTRE